MLAATSAFLVSRPSHATVSPRYRDATAPVEERVADLLQRMTLEEKVAQLGCLWLPKLHKMGVVDKTGRFVPKGAARALPHGIGQVAHLSDYLVPSALGAAPKPIVEVTTLANAIQADARHRTRLGIPVFIHEEATHGLYGSYATTFPSAMALASSWDPDLVRATFAVAAREARARGINIVLAPVLDVMREPRWGRADETFGEDPYLTGEMGLAAVRGLQGDKLPLGPDHVCATLKHFTGHGHPESGSNGGPADFSERTIRDVHIRPFARVIKAGRALSVMASYNEIGGIANHANGWLLTQVLRKEIDFQGFVMSDYGGVSMLDVAQHVVADLPSAAVAAIIAGVDVETPDFEAFPTLVDAARAGRVPEAVIDQAVERVLRVKFLAGLFEEQSSSPINAEAVTDTPESRALAQRAAERSIILLKNDNVLPLDRARVRKLAVVGPLANTVFLGGYAGYPRRKVSVLEGLREKLGKDAITYAMGARITAGEPDHFTVEGTRYDMPTRPDPEENRKLTAEAVARVAGADAIVLCVGDNENTAGESWNPNFHVDRAELTLFGGQSALFEALRPLGIPIIVLVFSARPLALTDVAAAPALAQCWTLGQETGSAVADMLFGDAPPGGKLTVSLPRSVGQLPVFYEHKPTGRGGYLFETSDPLFPFGHGLSYTKFKSSAPKLERSTIRPDEDAIVTVDVTNTGPRSGDEVVQLYVHDVVSSVTRPVKELAGFERITLAPGERRTVKFVVPPDALALTDRDMRRVVEPGAFELMVGPSSAVTQSVTLTVV